MTLEIPCGLCSCSCVVQNAGRKGHASKDSSLSQYIALECIVQFFQSLSYRSISATPPLSLTSSHASIQSEYTSIGWLSASVRHWWLCPQTLQDNSPIESFLSLFAIRMSYSFMRVWVTYIFTETAFSWLQNRQSNAVSSLTFSLVTGLLEDLRLPMTIRWSHSAFLCLSSKQRKKLVAILVEEFFTCCLACET